jgi:hypothetical protein
MSTLPLPGPASELQAPVMFYGKPLVYHHGRHMYFWDGQHVPSVTTIIRRLDKPGLIQWAAEEAVKAMQRGATPEEARKAHVRIKDAAADIGNVLHDIAEHIQRGTEPSTDLVKKLPVEDQLIASNCAIALKEWMAGQSFGPADLERRVMSRELMYAGRCDRFGPINGRLAVLDFKSGGDKIYPETWLQMSAYEIAIREEMGPLPPIWHYAIHLNKKTGKCTPHVRGPEHTGAAKEAWQQLVAFDKWMRQVPTEAQVRKAA